MCLVTGADGLVRTCAHGFGHGREGNIAGLFRYCTNLVEGLEQSFSIVSWSGIAKGPRNDSLDNRKYLYEG